LNVHFTNSSIGSFTKWLWHFGDGQTSKARNPNHTYRKAGVFTVTLTLTGAKGTITSTQPGLITVYAAPKAHFSAVPRSGDAPLTVDFINQSTGIVTSCLWNFGDGETSTDVSPAHTYESPRTYTAKLTVYGPGGSGSKTMSIHVKK
jgi:PKD repeat protein